MDRLTFRAGHTESRAGSSAKRPRPTTDDSLEKVKADIEAYKAERGPEVFACEENYIDETAAADLECICDDREAPPWARCAIHDSPID